jgi:hypothetical protein
LTTTIPTEEEQDARDRVLEYAMDYGNHTFETSAVEVGDPFNPNCERCDRPILSLGKTPCIPLTNNELRRQLRELRNAAQSLAQTLRDSDILTDAPECKASCADVRKKADEVLALLVPPQTPPTYTCLTVAELQARFNNDPMVGALAEAYTDSVEIDEISQAGVETILFLKEQAESSGERDPQTAARDLRWIGEFTIAAADELLAAGFNAESAPT